MTPLLTTLASLTSSTELFSTLMIVAMSVIVLIVLGSMLWKIRADRRASRALQQDPSLNPFVTPVMSDSGFPLAIVEKKTPREARTDEIRNRLATGLCLYCSDPAYAPLPTCRPVRPFFEGLLRYLNATPNARWAVQTERDADVPLAVCMKHHEQLVGLFEGAIAEERIASARFATEQRLALFAFEMHGADEAMRAAMQAIRTWRPQTGNGRAAEVVQLAKTNGRSS